MRLGNEAITSTHREKINPAEKGLLTIPAGDFALVSTLEQVELPSNLAGHIGLRSQYARRGLVLLSGPQIDPGFRGVLVLGVTNLSPRDIVIAHGERFCTVEFYQLSEPVLAPYRGEYQGQVGISASDLETLVEAQGMTFGQVLTTLNSLGASVKSLSDSVQFFKWAFPIGLAFIALLVSLFSIAILVAD
jgi:deoxycytidine triphosphate deaminase